MNASKLSQDDAILRLWHCSSSSKTRLLGNEVLQTLENWTKERSCPVLQTWSINEFQNNTFASVLSVNTRSTESACIVSSDLICKEAAEIIFHQQLWPFMSVCWWWQTQGRKKNSWLAFFWGAGKLSSASHCEDEGNMITCYLSWREGESWNKTNIYRSLECCIGYALHGLSLNVRVVRAWLVTKKKEKKESFYECERINDQSKLHNVQSRFHSFNLESWKVHSLSGLD